PSRSGSKLSRRPVGVARTTQVPLEVVAAHRGRGRSCRDGLAAWPEPPRSPSKLSESGGCGAPATTSGGPSPRRDNFTGNLAAARQLHGGPRRGAPLVRPPPRRAL